MKQRGSADITQTDLYRALLTEAHEALETEHKWLLDHGDLIVDLVERSYPCCDVRRRAQEVYNHLMKWGQELAWFTQPGAGKIPFSDVCLAAGADVEAARETRARYFKLPWPPMLVYNAMRSHGARTLRRGRPKKRSA